MENKTASSAEASAKAGKYFKYAIGEILLVVIGILIALQINNWNEQRKNDKSEVVLLQGLKQEFDYNLVELNKTIAINEEMNEACFAITSLIRKNQLDKNQKVLDSLLARIAQFSSFDARLGVTEEIINSGKLNILKNKELSNLISRWTGNLVDSAEDVTFRTENYMNILIPFLIQYFPLSNAELTKTIHTLSEGDSVALYKERSSFLPKFEDIDMMQFENVIWHHKHNNDYVIATDYSLKNEIVKILSLINSELSSKIN